MGQYNVASTLATPARVVRLVGIEHHVVVVTQAWRRCSRTRAWQRQKLLKQKTCQPISWSSRAKELGREKSWLVGLCARERRTGLGQWAGEVWAREGRGSGLLRRVHSRLGYHSGQKIEERGRELENGFSFYFQSQTK